MKGKGHFVCTTIFFIGLWIVFGLVLNKTYFTITQVLAAISISFFPDIDRNFKALGHRHWFTHSIILWEVVYAFNLHFEFLLLVLGVGFHCLCDIRINPKKQVGFYTIKLYGYKIENPDKKAKERYIWKYKSLDGATSTLLLNLNFWIAFIQFLLVIVLA